MEEGEVNKVPIKNNNIPIEKSKDPHENKKVPLANIPSESKIGIGKRIFNFFSNLSKPGIAITIGVIVFLVAALIFIPLIVAPSLATIEPSEGNFLDELGDHLSCDALSTQNHIARACKDEDSILINIRGFEGPRSIKEAMFYINGMQVGEFNVIEVDLPFGDLTSNEIINVSIAPITDTRELCPVSHVSAVVSCDLLGPDVTEELSDEEITEEFLDGLFP